MVDLATEPKKKPENRLTDATEALELALASGLDDAEQGRTVSLEEAIKRLQKDLQSKSI